MDLSIYDLLVRMLEAGERVKWISFHPTLTLELDKVNGRRVPYDTRMLNSAARAYLQGMSHGKSTPKIRAHTDRRDIFISPADFGQMVWHDRGTLETFTLPVPAEATGPGASQ